MHPRWLWVLLVVRRQANDQMHSHWTHSQNHFNVESIRRNLLAPRLLNLYIVHRCVEQCLWRACIRRSDDERTKRREKVRYARTAYCNGMSGMSHVHHSPFQFSFHFFASIYCCTNYFISTSIEVYNWSKKKSTSMHADDARCNERNFVHDEHTVNRRRHTIISHVQYKIIFMCFIVTFLSLFTFSSILRVRSLFFDSSDHHRLYWVMMQRRVFASHRQIRKLYGKRCY